MKKLAAIIVFDKFTDIDVFMPWDILNRVRLLDSEFEVKFLGTKSSHISVTGIELAMHGKVEEAADADLVYFSSGAGTRTLIKDPEYLSRLNLNTSWQVLCSMCSGSLLLAALGHLDGLSATTYSTAFQTLREFGVEVIEDAALIAHGKIATAAGCLAAVDLMSWAISKLYESETAERVIASVLPNDQGQKCIY